MDKRVIVIALPCYSGQPVLYAMTALVDEISNIAEKTGWVVKTIVRAGSGLLLHVRNSIVSEAKHMGATDLIMMDDDNYPEPGGLLKLLMADVDVVGIPVLARNGNVKWNVRWDVEKSYVQRDDSNNLIEVESVGTGIIRFRMSVIDKMIEADPECWYHDDMTPTKISWDLFRAGSKDHNYYGEDVYFCRRWRELGGKVWIEPDIITHHWGLRDNTDCVSRWLMQDMAPDFTFENSTSAPVKLSNDLSVLRLKQKSVALVIASRGNPDKLYKTVFENLKGIMLASTKVIVGLDDDDPTLEETKRLLDSLPDGAKDALFHVIGPREDSIGAVYNRCVEAIPADVYINGADDVVIKTKGWDARILKECEKFPDDIGVVGIGKMPVQSPLPAMSAVTRPMIDKMGYFVQPYTPFWWMDTWLYEISVMVGRQLHLDMVVECENWTRTRGMRELPYWAKFFDDSRPRRREIAERILVSGDFKSTPTVKQMMVGRLDALCAKFEFGNSILRDEEHAAKIMNGFAHDAPHDERYDRIKARSVAFLDQHAAA